MYSNCWDLNLGPPDLADALPNELYRLGCYLDLWWGKTCLKDYTVKEIICLLKPQNLGKQLKLERGWVKSVLRTAKLKTFRFSPGSLMVSNSFPDQTSNRWRQWSGCSLRTKRLDKWSVEFLSTLSIVGFIQVSWKNVGYAVTVFGGILLTIEFIYWHFWITLLKQF